MPRTIPTGFVALLVVAAPLAAVLGWGPDLPGAGPAADLPTRGQKQLHVDGGTWVDVAFEVKEDFSDDNVNITVYWSFGKQPWRDDTQYWTCAYIGTLYYGRLGETPSPYRCRDIPQGDADGAFEVDVEAGPVDQGASVPHPLHPVCEGVCYPQNRRVKMTMDGFTAFEDEQTWEEIREHTDDPTPVAHVTFWAGGLDTKSMDVEVEWFNTTLTTATGGGNDSFTYFPEDLDHTAYVRADTLPNSGMSQEYEASFNVTLMNGSDRPYVFTFDAGDDEQRNRCTGYQRPDGEVYEECLWWPTYPMFWNLSGEWSFWYEFRNAYGYDDPDSPTTARTDTPVLFGTQFDWAEHPSD